MKFVSLLFAAQLAAAGLIARSPCSPLEVLISRGTGEPGPYGVVVGDNIVADLKEKMPSATAWNNPYPANLDTDSAVLGANNTVAHLKEQTAACPDQKFALVGYSQGAAVLHLALADLPPADISKIVAIVTFGDPGSPGPKSTTPIDQFKNIPAGLFKTSSGAAPTSFPKALSQLPPFPEALQARTLYNCHPGDPVCGPGDDFLQHVLYEQGTWIPDSVNFILKEYKM